MSQRAATAVLVMLTLTASLAPIRVGAQQTQTAELSRKAKSKGDSQPALNLAEGEYQLPPLGL